MKIIDGYSLAKNIKENIKKIVNNYNNKPCLAVILVGNDEASKIYVKNKEKACNECGFKSIIKNVDENIKEDELLKIIYDFNNDKNINGILVQFPLPKHINFENIISKIDPKKDVDCFNLINVGKFFSGKNYFTSPCTANGCIKLIKTVLNDFEGKNALVIGRSNIVGKPVAQMLLNESCTVTIAHSKTKNLDILLKNSDIIVIAIGKPKFLKSDMIKDDAIIIDVGINRLEDHSICGDVDFDDFIDKNCFLTPVPRGVGPMTIACLLENTLKCFLEVNSE